MSAAASFDSPTERLQRLLGTGVVLLPTPRGEKGPRMPSWPKCTLEIMDHPEHVEELNRGEIAVLLGEASGGLYSIDFDQESVGRAFLEMNPQLNQSLQTRGARGFNVWLYVDGDCPRDTCRLVTRAGEAVGEWRSNRSATKIMGTHPAGVEYQILVEKSPVRIRFADINWPADIVPPVVGATTADQARVGVVVNGETAVYGGCDGDPIMRMVAHDVGAPVIWDASKKKITGVNEAFWAVYYRATHDGFYEPYERRFYDYNKTTGLYEVVSEDSIRGCISMEIFNLSRTHPNLERLANYRTAQILKGITSQLRGVKEERGAFSKHRGMLHLANGMLEVASRGEVKLLPFSPDYYSRNQSPIAYVPGAECPRFLNELVMSAVPADGVSVLQKFAGQCLLGRNLVQRMLILQGRSGAGKSTLVSVIQAVVGLVNVTQLRTEQLSGRFETNRYIGKTLLVGADVDADFFRAKGASVVKTLVGGDWLDTERKGESGSFPIQGVFNVIVTTNEQLGLSGGGDSEAWRRRLVVVRYELPPPGKRIPDFADLLIREEGSGILNWMIAGLQALLCDIEQIGGIVLTPRQAAAGNAIVDCIDTVEQFVTARLVRAPGSVVSVAEICKEYTKFCDTVGVMPLSEHALQRKLTTTIRDVLGVRQACDIQVDGRARRGFHGIGFGLGAPHGA